MPRCQPVWMHTDDKLVVRVGHRAEPVPEPIDDWLIGENGVGVTADPAADLLRLEGVLITLATELVTKSENAAHTVAMARSHHDDTAAQRGWHARSARREARTSLDQAITAHTSATEALEDAWTLVEVLREFVVQIEPVDGPLREAVDGWSRSPALDRLAGVTVFDDEEQFLLADPRRERENGLGYPALVGDQFGTGWRRDGDDDFTGDRPETSGRWTVAYIPRTGEIYASRHTSFHPSQVWLLGSGFADVEQVHAMLADLESSMRQPNSLILVAERVHGTRPLNASGELVLPQYRRDSGEIDLRHDRDEQSPTGGVEEQRGQPGAAPDRPAATDTTTVSEVA